MALIGNISISMTTQTAKFQKGLRQATIQLKEFEHSAHVAGLAIGAAFVGASYLAYHALIKLVTAGSDIVESQNKLKEVFGDSAKEIILASEQMQGAFGVSKKEFQDAAGTLGAIFEGVGYTAKDAATLAVSFSKLAVDAASFYNIPVADALQKIEAGLVGQVRPLRELGVLLDDDSVKQYAYTTGLAKLGAELTQAQKVYVRTILITQGLSKAQGDVARTADEVANASRGVMGRIEALAETIGTQLQPIAKAVLSDISTLLTVIDAYWKNVGTSAANAAVVTAGAAEIQARSIGPIQQALGSVADSVQYIGQVWTLAQANTTASIAGIIAALAPYEDKLRQLAKLAQFAFNPIGAAKGAAMSFMGHGMKGQEKGELADLSKDMFKAADEQFKKAQEQFNKPLPSEGINKAFEDARKKAEALRAELGKGKIDPNAIKPDFGKVLTKPGEIKFAKSESFGSQGAVNTILRSQFGGNKGKPAEKAAVETARNTADALKLLAKIAGQKAEAGDMTVWQDFG